MERIDKYGHCVKCAQNLIIERVVEGKVVSMFSSDHSETEFLLTDGSRMRVCICKKCKYSIDLQNEGIQEDIMNCVKRGWQEEVNSLVADSSRPDWTPDRGKDHLDKYNSKKIEVHSESVSKSNIEDRKKKIKSMKAVK